MKNFIYILSFLLIIPISFILVACDNNSSPEKTSEGFAFELSLDMNSYTISGIGDCTDKDIVFPSSYNGLPIIAIKKEAFKNNTGIQAITIPDTIKSVGENAFSNCSNLKIINVKGSKTYYDSFDNCRYIEKVKIDNIDNWCSSIFSSPKANPLSYGAKLFENDSEITALSTNSNIGNYAFYNYKMLNELNLTSGCAKIGISAFENNDALKNIYLKGKIIADYNAFYNCINVEKVICNNLTLWTQSTFQNQTSNPIYYSENLYSGNNEVKEISIETSSLSKYLFINCKSIEDINIVGNIYNIGRDAFYGCSSIKNIKINKLSSWLNVQLENLYSNPTYGVNNVYINDTLITELIIPEGISKINAYQFFGWKNIEKICIPQTVQEIGIGAFGGFNQLQEITIPFIGKLASEEYYPADKAKYFHFGYMFGDIEYEKSYHQSGYNVWYYVEYNFYIPLSLETIYITQGNSIDDYISNNFSSIDSDKENYMKYVKK